MEKNINRAINYITSQLIEEALAVIDYKDEDCTKPARNLNLIFPVAFSLHSLGFITSPSVKRWKKVATNFLISEGGKTFAFNYHSKVFNKDKEFTLPDDLDDTALCLAALIKNNIEVDTKYFLNLINTEINEGGPYQTWYLKDYKIKKWFEADPFVNAHLIYALSLQNIRLQNTEKFLLECIKQDKVHSNYYPYKVMFYLYIARFLNNIEHKELRTCTESFLKTFDFSKAQPIEKILFLLTNVYLNNTIPDEYLQEVIKLQNKDGSLHAMPLCYGYAYENKKTFTGCKLYPTALFLELLLICKSKRSLVQPKSRDNTQTLETIQEILYKEIQGSGFEELFEKSFSVKTKIKPILLSLEFAQSLDPKLKELTTNQLNSINASYFGWLAFTLIDDLIDKQAKVDSVPLVSFLLRKQYLYLSKIKLKGDFLKEMFKALLVSEQNYYWEYHFTKLNKKNSEYYKKNDFNYMHIEKRLVAFLTYLSYLPEILGKKTSEQERNSIYNFFKNLMIIDQINDDSHDWKIDIKEKRITFVIAELIKNDYLNKKDELIFWEKVTPKIIQLCEKHRRLALKNLEELTINTELLKNLLDKSFAPIKQLKAGIKDVKKIMEYYEAS